MFKKNLKNRKVLRFLMAAILAGTLTGSQISPVLAISDDHKYEKEEKTILDTIIIEESIPLEEITLPKSIYGKLTWSHPLYVPTEEEEDCEVILEPDKDVDVSWMKGWDAKTRTVLAYITIRVEKPEQEDTDTDLDDDVDRLDGDENISDDQNSEIEIEYDSDEYEDDEFDSDDYEDDEFDSDDYEDDEYDSDDCEDVEEDSDGYEDEEDDSDEYENDEYDSNEYEDEEDDSDEYEDDEENSDEYEDDEEDSDEYEDDENDSDDYDDNESEDPYWEFEFGDEDESVDSDTGVIVVDPEIVDKNENYPHENDEHAIEKNPQDATAPGEKIETIFDHFEIQLDSRPAHADENLNADEKRATGIQNHRCEGIVISGEQLPWYVQFRVYDGTEYEFTNQEGADLFRAYEFILWDTLNDQKYEVPEGEYITVRMTVPEGYDYTVEHILSTGGKESIHPLLDGTTLAFCTHSFSPFGIAGSTNIVGGGGMEGNYSPTPEPTKAPTPKPTKTPAKTPTPVPTKAPVKTSTPVPTKVPEKTPTKVPVNVENNQNSGNHGNSNSQNSLIPNTGDNSMIGLYAGIAGGALLLIILAIVILIRKRK